MVDIKDHDDQRGYSEQDQQSLVLMIEGLSALQAGYQGSGNPPDRGDDEENTEVHGSQAKDIAQSILWKPRNEKQDKAEDHAFMPDEVIEFFPRPDVDKFLNSHSFKDPCQAESKQGTQNEPDHGVEKPHLRSEEIPSDKFDGPSGDGSDNDLHDLHENIGQRRIRTEGGDQLL